MKKKIERAAKKKEKFVKLCAPVRSPLSPHPEFSLLLSPRSVPAPVPALVPASIPALMPALFSYPGSPFVLSSTCVPAPATVSCQAFMSPLSVLGLLLLFEPSPLRIFNRSLSDEPWPHVLTSLAKPFCAFPALSTLNPDNNNGLYNPTDKSKHKWVFNTAFINSCPLANNHNQEEVDLSFAGCRCPAAVKLN